MSTPSPPASWCTSQTSSHKGVFWLIPAPPTASFLTTHQPTGPLLAGPDGHPQACWGDKPVQLVLDGRHFQWTFLLAAVQCPIIGVNFLRAHQLLVDPLSSLWFLKADTDKPHPGAPGISTVLWTRRRGVVLGCLQPIAHPLGPLHLHFLPWCLHRRRRHGPTSQRQWHNCFWSFRMSSIPPSSYQQLSMMFFTTSRQWVLL